MRLKTIALFVLWPLDRGLALLAYVGVCAYRRWFSHRKGFKCAAAALTDQPSCSDVTLRAFREMTFSRAVPIVRAQLALCRKTYANYTNNVITSANAHLSQFAALATAGALGCCDGCPGGPVDPLPLRNAPRVVVERQDDRPVEVPDVKPEAPDDPTIGGPTLQLPRALRNKVSRYRYAFRTIVGTIRRLRIGDAA